MDRQKVITDWMITVQDTVYTLQVWLGLLENWRALGQAEADDFNEACHSFSEKHFEFVVMASAIFQRLKPLLRTYESKHYLNIYR